MFGISTSWNAYRHDSALSMVGEIKGLGIDCVELNFTLPRRIVDEAEGLVADGLIKVLSVHNFCPVPDSVDIKKASPDYYSLASIDEAERKRAVEETKRTIDTAFRLKAKAVVVHSGRLNIRDMTRKLAKEIDKGGDVRGLTGIMQRQRDEELKKGYLDSLLESMGELSHYSKNSDIKIGLENRFYYRELPSVEEFEAIFNAFGPDSNICYWHDTGHAKVFENLGLTSNKEYLDKFSDRLVGVHLHDVEGTIDDHKAPLEGSFDFSSLKPFLNKDMLKVLEPHAPAGPEQIKKGLEYLKKLLGED